MTGSQRYTSSDLLSHKNMFRKSEIHIKLPWFECGASRQLDSEVPQCFFVFSFSKISILSVVFVPRLLLQGIRCLVKAAVEMCVTEFGVLCSSYLSHEERRRPIPASARTGSERSFRQWSNWALHTHKHTDHIYDGHQRRAQWLPLLLNSRTPIIKRSPSSIKTNSLDCALLLSIGLTDTNDCVTPPPLPHPLLTVPVSHRALAQSREIVSCLFLNTHLYLTAYWVSISPNVHYV